MLSAYKGEPIRPVPFNKGKIEHIHHPAIEQCVVACAEGYEIGHYGCGGIVEYHTIEQTVNDISRGTGKYQRETGKKQIVHSLPYQLDQYIYKEAYRHNTEGGEEEFVHQFHTEGHASILGKENLEPRGYVNDLMHVHAGLYPYLDNLVYEYSRQRYASGRDSLSILSAHAVMLHLFNRHGIASEAYLCGKNLACNIVVVCCKARTCFLCIGQSDNDAVCDLESAVLAQLLD